MGHPHVYHSRIGARRTVPSKAMHLPSDSFSRSSFVRTLTYIISLGHVTCLNAFSSLPMCLGYPWRGASLSGHPPRPWSVRTETSEASEEMATSTCSLKSISQWKSRWKMKSTCSFRCFVGLSGENWIKSFQDLLAVRALLTSLLFFRAGIRHAFVLGSESTMRLEAHITSCCGFWHAYSFQRTGAQGTHPRRDPMPRY